MSALAYGGRPPARRRSGRGCASSSRSSRRPGVVFLLMIPPTLAAMLADDRLHLGLDIWLKPMKFQVALAIFAFTLAVYARWLPAGTLGRRWYRVYVGERGRGDGGGDRLDLGRGGARHRPRTSTTTPVGMAFYAAAGVLAVWFTGATLVYGVLIARNRRPGFDPALRTGLALGLVLTFVLSVAFAGVHEQLGQPLRRRGRRATRAGSWPMGWSRDGGRSARGAFLRDARDARGAARGVRGRAWCWRGGRRSGRPGGSRRSGRRSASPSSRRRWRGAVPARVKGARGVTTEQHAPGMPGMSDWTRTVASCMPEPSGTGRRASGKPASPRASHP